MSATILILWSGVLCLTAGRLTSALLGPAAHPLVRLAGGAVLAAALLAVRWWLIDPEERSRPERAHDKLMLAIVIPGLLLLQVPLPLVGKGMALLVPQLAEAPVEASRLMLVLLVWGWALVGLAIAIAVRLPRIEEARHWRGLFIGLLAIHGALTVWSAQIQTLTGDEPHYLLAARSLVRDGDVDLTNDYAEGLYREVFPTDVLRRALPELAPELDPHDVPGPRGERRPVHQLGMSLLLAPGYALAGVMGARLVAVLIAALAGWLVVRLAVEVAGEAGWTGGLLVALLSPLLALGATLHSEPAAVVCLTWLAWQAARPGRGPRAMGVSAVAAGFVCWLHLKLLPAEMLLVIWLTIQSRRAGEATWWLPAFGLGIGLVSQLSAFSVMYGSWRPDAPQLAGAGKFPSAFGGRWWEGLPGLLFDQQDGLFMAWPVGLVLAIGMVRLWRQPATKWLVAVIGVHLALIASFELWRSGFAPAGRQLLPVVGLLGAFVGEGWRGLHRGLVVGQVLCNCLLAINVMLVALLAWVPRLRYPYEALEGFRRSPLLAKLPLPGLDVLWPALDRGGAALVAAWVYLLAWVIVSNRVGRRSEA